MNILDFKVVFNQYNYTTINDVLISKITSDIALISNHNIQYDCVLNLCKDIYDNMYSFISYYKLNVAIQIDTFVGEKACIKFCQKNTKMPLFGLIVTQ